MQNTYSKNYSHITYVSDSGGIWRHKPIYEVLKENNNKVQVLTHPIWWQNKLAISPKEKVKNTIYQRAENSFMIYNNLIKTLGRENI
jgi:hypothetical protein